jgi:hypothetical protein
MRWLWAIALGLSLGAQGAELNEVKTVYLLPMVGGLDQHLANHFTQKGLFQVVTDPKKADAIFTDRLGEGFEERFRELFGDPEPKVKDEKEPSFSSNRPRSTSFSRGRGTLFLVGRESHAVIWSIFAPPKNTRSPELSRNAEQIAKRIEEAKKGPKSK